MKNIKSWKEVDTKEAQAAIESVLKDLGVGVSGLIEGAYLKEVVLRYQGNSVRLVDESYRLAVYLPQQNKRTIYEVTAMVFSGDEELATVTKTFYERHEASIYQEKLEEAIQGVRVTVEEKEVEVEEKDEDDE